MKLPIMRREFGIRQWLPTRACGFTLQVVSFYLQCLAFISFISYGTSINAADSCYQFQVQSVAYTTPWLADPDAACLDYANYCAGTPDGTKQSYCPVTDNSSSPGHYSINYTIHYSWENSSTLHFPQGLWCAVTTNATYHYVNGNTATNDYGPGEVAIPYRTNPSGCQVFVIVPPVTAAQCGPTCNGVAEPINPVSGAVYDTVIDVASTSGSATGVGRSFNSTDTGNADLSGGWRHSYSRSVTPKYLNLGYKPYIASPDYSALYDNEASACVSGFNDIKSRVATWLNAGASYSNGVCVLKSGTTVIGTLSLYYTSPSNLAPGMQVIGFDATRDDGQLTTFSLINGVITAPPGIALQFVQTGSGFTVTDANNNVEQYDTNGKLLNITSRAGVVQTMSYDASGRLSSVTDSFGHQLTLGYDAQSHLTTVTRQ